MKMLIIAIPVLALIGCSKPASKADPQVTADMQSISNLFLNQGWPPAFKKSESGALGNNVSFRVAVGGTNATDGTNVAKRYYMVTWKDHKWQISPTNH